MNGAPGPCPAPSGPDDRFPLLCVPAHWQAVDFISDLHLHDSDPATADAWLQYLSRITQASTDALFILGDLFEVWIGDDVLSASEQLCPEAPFLRRCADALHTLAQRVPVYFMAGNRDFLLGTHAAAQCGMTLLDDPTVLQWHDQRWLLSHGDALCLADTAYQAFRHQVRSAAWQASFLGQTLSEREAVARQLRQQSEARKRLTAGDSSLWADADDEEAVRWLLAARAQGLIHGHTHRPACHPLAQGLQRWVLSDWDLAAQLPRGEILRLDRRGLRRVPLKKG